MDIPYTINIHEWISIFYGYPSLIILAFMDAHLDILVLATHDSKGLRISLRPG